MTEKICLRCLISELDPEGEGARIADGIAKINEADKCTGKDYDARLQMCRNCDKLISGTCLSCGCYVEIRAAIKKGRCPEKKW